MSIEVYERLFESKLIAKTLTLELKDVHFNNKQKSITFNHFVFEK